MDIIEEYLDQLKQGRKNAHNFFDNSIETYKRKLEVFAEYIFENKIISYENHLDFIRNLKNYHILDSIKFYKNKYNIRHRATIDCYITVLKNFYEFLEKEHSIINPIFDSKKEGRELDEEINKLVDELGLEKSKQKEIIEKDNYILILNKCNEYIDKYDVKDIIAKSRNYTKFTSGIITKLVMFTGIKNKVLANIKIKDVTTNSRLIKINDFSILLPVSLNENLKKYINVRTELLNGKNKQESLFIQYNGGKIGTNNTLMYEVLKILFNRRLGESVAKFAIMEMIRKDISISLITQMTGFSDGTYYHCEDAVKENDKKNINILNKELNDKLRKTIGYGIM